MNHAGEVASIRSAGVLNKEAEFKTGQVDILQVPFFLKKTKSHKQNGNPETHGYEYPVQESHPVGAEKFCQARVEPKNFGAVFPNMFCKCHIISRQRDHLVQGSKPKRN